VTLVLNPQLSCRLVSISLSPLSLNRWPSRAMTSAQLILRTMSDGQQAGAGGGRRPDVCSRTGCSTIYDFPRHSAAVAVKFAVFGKSSFDSSHPSFFVPSISNPPLPFSFPCRAAGGGAEERGAGQPLIQLSDGGGGGGHWASSSLAGDSGPKASGSSDPTPRPTKEPSSRGSGSARRPSLSLAALQRLWPPSLPFECAHLLPHPRWIPSP
jgi:hypothetical protein